MEWCLSNTINVVFSGPFSESIINPENSDIPKVLPFLLFFWDPTFLLLSDPFSDHSGNPTFPRHHQFPGYPYVQASVHSCICWLLCFQNYIFQWSCLIWKNVLPPWTIFSPVIRIMCFLFWVLYLSADVFPESQAFSVKGTPCSWGLRG